MKHRKWHNLRFVLVLVVFVMLCCSFGVVSLLMILLLRLGLISTEAQDMKIRALLMIAANIGISTLIMTFLGKIILRPIRKLAAAMEEVARGNFNVRLKAYRNDELSILIHSFNKMAHELSGIESMRADFITTISHEFKTPLASIMGYAAMLKDEDITAGERNEYTNTIIAATRRLSALSSDILKLSKLENQGIIPEKTGMRLDEQIRLAILSTEPEWSAKSLEMDIELDPVNIISSPELINQVWMNLLGNAIKFTNIGGTIRVTLTDRGQNALVEISDSGIGMNDNTQKHIFEKFYQGDKGKSEGSGLGLPLAKRITELYGGRIDVRSEPGKGSVFSVTLPKEP